jgi:hypothetical protein
VTPTDYVYPALISVIRDLDDGQKFYLTYRIFDNGYTTDNYYYYVYDAQNNTITPISTLPTWECGYQKEYSRDTYYGGFYRDYTYTPCDIDQTIQSSNRLFQTSDYHGLTTSQLDTDPVYTAFTGQRYSDGKNISGLVDPNGYIVLASDKITGTITKIIPLR